LDAETGDILQLPGNEGQFQVEKVSGNLRGMMGPAALIRIRPHEGKETLFWVFQNEEMLRKRFPTEMFQSPILNSSAFKPYTFFLEGLESKYSTGLQVNKDPGVPIVWLGCFLMVAGFFVTFFTSHRRIWIRLSKEKQGIKISVSGTANKNRVGLQRELKHLTNNLKKLINEKG
jgi:cytochrome c biogenesis protein